ncbi:DJ-1/PfpI family protein [Atrimonas thermophila]|uniref:DJ-1/PfpI family protein n=1 Tax=Atrimonas thermophila TaxID=3064161 RepID=UPI00399C8EF1
MRRLWRAVVLVSLLCFGFVGVSWGMDFDSFLQEAQKTGITIEKIGEVIAWTGEYGGKMKPNGPLAGKKIGILVGCDFSDWQAYYFANFVGEFGGIPQFILSNNHLWKVSRALFGSGEPVEPTGRWGLTCTAGFSGLGINGNRVITPAVLQPGKGHVANLPVANPEDYDALIIIGGWSGDIMYADDVAINFVKAVVDRGIPVAAIGEGILPLIKVGAVNGKKVTGNRVVDYMLKRVADFRNEPVVVDGNLITGRDTVDAPAVLRALCKVFDPNFVDIHKNILKGKKVMVMVADDFEDIELCSPALEFMYRGAELVVGLFKPYIQSRPPLVGLDVRIGNFGVSIPFQEIPDSYYKIIKAEDLKMSDFDLLWIPGAMNPLHIAALHRDFLKDAYNAGKIVAVICHGPIPAAAADLVAGRSVAGWLACTSSIELCGGKFMPDWAAAIDGRLVSGRTPPEVPEFVDACTAALLRK